MGGALLGERGCFRRRGVSTEEYRVLAKHTSGPNASQMG